MINRVFMLLILTLLVGCKSESGSTKAADAMKEAFVQLIGAEQPDKKVEIYDAKVVGDLGVIFADLHPGSGRKSATVYMHYKDEQWVHVSRIDVWSNNPRYLFPRMRIPEALHSHADELDSWVLEQIGGDASSLWLAEQGIIKSEQGGAHQPTTR